MAAHYLHRAFAIVKQRLAAGPGRPRLGWPPARRRASFCFAMHGSLLLRGLVIGFSIAAPVGPIGVLCIRRSLGLGARAGFASGLGAATADAAYGCVAGFGLTSVSGLLVRWQSWLGLGGGIFLCWLGLRSFLRQAAQEPARDAPGGPLAGYSFTVILTLSNPATILSFAAVFTGFGLGAYSDYASAAVLVLGIFAGSAAWWLILCGSVGLLRSRVKPGWLLAVNRASGAVLFGFGVCAILKTWL
jgi:threonine/homoserine/homoserine lactone efflux protein